MMLRQVGINPIFLIEGANNLFALFYIQQMLEILPTLTKNYILSQVSELDIFSKYSGLPAYEILEVAETNSLILSPLRSDETPTVGFTYNRSNRLKMRDFAGYFWGDCFDLVAYRLNLDANVSNHFAIILDRIAKDFQLHKYKNSKTIVTFDKIQSLKKKDYVHFDVEIRKWNKVDIQYWKHLTGDFLKSNYIFPIQHLDVNKQLRYTYQDNDPAYGYYFNDGRWKIYFPFRDKFRFLSNTSIAQGINTFKGAETGIFIKSYKDLTYLRFFRDTLGIDGLAPTCETASITPGQYKFLLTKAPKWFSFMDYDNTGIRLAWKLRKDYGIPPLFMREKTWARKKGFEGCKDFSEYCMKYGMIKGEKLLINLLKPNL